MGRKVSYSDLDPYDNPNLLADLDDEELYDEYLVKPDRLRARRKQRAKIRARNRFSDYEGERWLRRQVADWDDYDTFSDLDDMDFSVDIPR